jgi:hypothetical protein
MEVKLSLAVLKHHIKYATFPLQTVGAVGNIPNAPP